MLKRIAIGFSALLAICVLLFVLSSSSSFQDCIARQNDAYAQQTKKDPPKFFFALANLAAACVKCTGHLVYEYRDAVTAVATVFIGIFTLTLKLSTDKLWTAAKGQIAVAENAARIQSADMDASIAVAKEAADAAKQSVGVAQQSLVASNRPWMGLNGPVEIVETLTFDDSGASAKIRVPIINSGNSVAIGVFTINSLIIGQMPPITTKFHGPVLRFIIESKHGISSNPDFVKSWSNDIGNLILPWQPFCKDEIFTLTAVKSTFIADAGIKETSAWVPFCIGYQDQFGIPHATFFILLFRTAAGIDKFEPFGPIAGNFFVFGLGGAAY